MPLLLEHIMILAALGGVAGLLAGLFGIGGGVVLVPGLYYILTHIGFDAHAMHIAVGTSLSTIVFTGSMSAWSHYKRQSLDFSLFRRLIVGVVVGVGIGSYIAGRVDTEILKGFFAVTQIVTGSYMLIFGRRAVLAQDLPPQPFTSAISAVIGCLATLKGVGGGVQNVLFMTLCNTPIHKAIGTASFIGIFIALSGAAGYAFIGQGANNLPAGSIGYVFVPAMLSIISCSMISAPIGARLAHYLPVDKLKKLFSLFMIGIAIKMVAELI